MKKVVIIGGVAGGASAAARIRRLDEDAQITILERGPHISYSNCSLPFYLSRVVENSDDLLMMTPERFKKQYNIDVYKRCEAFEIDRKQKQVRVKRLDSGEVYCENYDKLVLAPGAAPVKPRSIKGVDRENVFGVRNVEDIRKLDTYLHDKQAKDVVVVGGGFIGIEVTENLTKAGVRVHLIESMNQILTPFDEDMVQTLHKEMLDNGVELCLGESVSEIRADRVLCASGKEVKADAVVMAVGVRPETGLAIQAGLEIGKTGGIVINANCQTSDPNIYAVGDAVEVYSELKHQKTRLTMAGVAQWQARAAADHMYGKSVQGKGVLGSSVLRVFSMNAACTGLNERNLKELGIPYQFAYVLPGDKVGIMPNAMPMFFKLLFEAPTGRILGAQAIGMGEVDKRVNVIATMLRMNGTLEDLKDLELCYSPLFSTAKDVVNYAALVGLNVLKGCFRQVPVTQVRKLVEENACIIDVRERAEYEHGHLIGAINIPLSQLRERMNEIPKDRSVYLHCRSSQRSYNAVMALIHNGYENVYNISGSYLGISMYEYFTDTVTGRKPIVTAYNFN